MRQLSPKHNVTGLYSTHVQRCLILAHLSRLYSLSLSIFLVLVYCCCYCLPLQGPEDLAPHPLTTGSQLISAVLPLEHKSSFSAPSFFLLLSLIHHTSYKNVSLTFFLFCFIVKHFHYHAVSFLLSSQLGCLFRTLRKVKMIRSQSVALWCKYVLRPFQVFHIHLRCWQLFWYLFSDCFIHLEKHLNCDQKLTVPGYFL